MIKNTNINEESVNAVKEFQKKQINTNIFLHKIFLFFLICLDFALLSFIIIYKSKISEIKSKTNKNSSSISNDKDSIAQNRNEIDHKILNILANGFGGFYHFSFIFETKKEIDNAKNCIVEFYKQKNKN